MAPITVTILYDKGNPFGLQEDVLVLERLLKTVSLGFQKPRLVDMREPLVFSDMQFHLEVPVYAAIPWAHTNVLLVNPEHWVTAYDEYVPAFDALVFRDPVIAEQFREELEVKGIFAHIVVLPWCALPAAPVAPAALAALAALAAPFVTFVGGSTNKYEYLKKLLPHWDSSMPLTVYTTRKDVEEGLGSLGATVICKDIGKMERTRILMESAGYLCVSTAEGFGYAAAEAERCGVFTIMNDLSVWRSMYQEGVAWLSSPTRESLDAAFAAFREADKVAIRKVRQACSAARFGELCRVALPLLRSLQEWVLSRRPTKGVFHCPPLLHMEDCPPITIVTPTYNRKQLIEIAFHNLLATDYPHEKIEWIVIEDNEKTPHLAGEKIMDFQLQVPKIRLKYIPIEGRMSIGEKRNCAIREASHDILLFMDDDDHYPPTSFRRRVAWLTKGVKRGETTQTIACCTTLALYDLKYGTSAVNVPPFGLPFSQRVSEATLTFRKSAWEERPFPHVSVAEGEGWLEGRANQVIEIPPQQIIVAFTHGNNQSSRRVPMGTPSCFWGFPKEYLIFIHGLAGVQVEEDTTQMKKRH